jgi:acyl-CoA thioester hydrolase
MKHVETITRNISFCDVDFTGVMWHGNYIKYFEDARCNLFEKLGFSYETILSKGYGVPIISMKIKYIRPCTYNQKINIEAAFEESEHLLIVKHEMRDVRTNEKICRAETRQVAFCLETQKSLLQLPDFILMKLNKR